MTPDDHRIAVVIPCLNEEMTIGKVVQKFKTHLPSAEIYVFDNNSSDGTASISKAAGATVIRESRQGKGYVVQSMFKKIEADIYVMVDGDDTYPAQGVQDLLNPILNDEADITIGTRLSLGSRSEFKRLNKLGNRVFLLFLNCIFGSNLTDMLSGYRAMTRGFVKSVPIFSTGFEIETELTIRALEKGFRIQEVPVDLKSRPNGSKSKIKVWRDGLRILGTIFLLFRDYKPMILFGGLGVLLIAAGIIPGIIVINEFMRTGLVLHMPSAVLAVGLVLSGLLSITVSLVISTVNRRFQELEYRINMLAEGVSKRQ